MKASTRRESPSLARSAEFAAGPNWAEGYTVSLESAAAAAGADGLQESGRETGGDSQVDGSDANRDGRDHAELAGAIRGSAHRSDPSLDLT